MKEKYLVSICIPVYNGENYIVETLQSIKKQSYQNIEVVLSDNASMDNSVRLIENFIVENNLDWILLRNKENIGANDNFNKLITNAKGDFISIYHADDIYHKDIVKESVHTFITNPDIGFVGTLGKRIDIDGETISRYTLPKEFKKCDNKYTFDDLFFAATNFQNNDILLLTPSIMVKKDVYDEVGLFNINYKSACDYELWFRISVKYSFYLMDKPLFSYRIHNQQGSQKEIRENVDIPDLILVCEEYVSKLKNKKLKDNYQQFYDKIIIICGIKTE